MWAGISSGPSAVWIYRSLFSGTNFLKKFSISFKTEGSAFSWIIKDAEVCFINKVQLPSLIFDNRTSSLILEVMSFKLFAPVLIRIVLFFITMLNYKHTKHELI